MKFLALFLLIAIATSFSLSWLLNDPPVWPDEAIYADIAANVLNENRLGTNLWQGTIPNVEQHAFWYPPAFFYTLSLWFKVTGFSIVSQRTLSVIVGIGFILFFYFAGRNILAGMGKYSKVSDSWLLIFVIGAMMVDFIFQKANRISRPEIFVLFWGSLATLFMSKLWLGKSTRLKEYFWLVLSGLCSAMAFLNHTIGAFFFIFLLTSLFIYNSWRVIKSFKLYLFILSFILPLVIWLISIFPDIAILKEQLFLATVRKNLEEPWLWSELLNQGWLHRLILASYLTITFLFFLLSFNRRKEQLLVSIGLILSWGFSLYGKMGWYLVFPIPFVYLSLLLFLKRTSARWEEGRSIGKELFLFAVAVTIIISVLNINVSYISNMKFLEDDEYSYESFTKEILEKIPDQKTVFLSAIPDPYFEFKNLKRSNRLYEFPVLQTSKKNYLDVLNNTDYIIYNGSYDYLVFGNFLQRYILKNQLRIERVGHANQYEFLIIELKPRDQRDQLLQ